MKRAILVKQKRKSRNTSGTTSSETKTDVLQDVKFVAFDDPSTYTARLETVISQSSLAFTPYATICTRMPPSPVDSRGTTECIISAQTKFDLVDFSDYPLSSPQDPPSRVYEIRQADSKGLGMFATRALSVGELILVERPMMIMSSNRISCNYEKCFFPIPDMISAAERVNREGTPVYSMSLEVFQASLQVGTANASTTNVIPDIKTVMFYPIETGSSIYTVSTVLGPSDSDLATIPFDATLCTTVPRSLIDSYGTSECSIAAQTKIHLIEIPNYPCSPLPNPPSKVYEIRRTESMGLGMFSMCALNISDLILVERPLMVAPTNRIADNYETCFPAIPDMVKSSERVNREGTPVYSNSLGKFQSLLELLFERMSEENQKIYLDLSNVHRDDPHLVGFWRTNAFDVEDMSLGDQQFYYSAVFREMSRVNHCCQPNCALSFDPASFSMQLRATRPISSGEEIVICYCDATASVSERTAQLASFGITCSCPACVPMPGLSVPMNNTIRSSIPDRIKALDQLLLTKTQPSADDLMTMVTSGVSKEMSRKLRESHATAEKIYDDARALMRDMEQEGLDGYKCYLQALEIREGACMELSYTSTFVFSEFARARWDAEVKRLALTIVRLARAHIGSFKKHYLEESLGRFDFMQRSREV
ncbi:hypothetical protein BDQ17DRAFT_1433098 [Cyathus striatus]|nr:hypothetical protein BDQ17DRAFT_1433098 [Cyathus striatus]